MQLYTCRFQSLFYWKSHCNYISLRTICRKTLVSILVLLEVSLQLSQEVEKEIARLGFNPCFTGSLTATQSRWKDMRHINRFQSLFYWKSHCNLVALCSNQSGIYVSILVLLEVSLQQPSKLNPFIIKLYKPFLTELF